ncbi:7415_t:CDS:10 [Diversispora eburnea]|uniref:7415_t:CDS:1 n=1 Tax=Diversispora eburnea TaxID=1213867 RepID=A0A9N9BE46_9GLOM|nr:7415_t:CDS:10 [Diversispora eburnea]
MDPQNDSSNIVTQQKLSHDEIKEDAKELEYKDIKEKLEKIFQNLTVLFSKDLYKTIERYEKDNNVTLLKDETRPIFQKFCDQNPDMEVSVDDVMQLVKRLQAPSQSSPTPPVGSNVASESTGTRRSMIKFGTVRSSVRSLGPTRKNRSNFRNREPVTTVENDEEESGIGPTLNRSRSSLPYGFNDTPNSMNFNYPKPLHDPSEGYETSFEGSGGFDETVSQLFLSTTDDPAVQLSRLYRHTVDLTKRLKESERHLASVARQHEDRIEELQHRLEETKADLVAKKREIQDHKHKEKTNLHQISALEGEIQKVARDLTGQKQLYHHLKKQYEEQCEEAEKLKDLVRGKEEELSIKQRNLNQISIEEKRWSDDRDRLEVAISKLEKDIAAAHATEKELEVKRNENTLLKETINKLRTDLEDIRSGGFTEFDVVAEGGTFKDNEFDVNENLQAELYDHAQSVISEEQELQEEPQEHHLGSDSNTDDVGRLPHKVSPRRPNDVSDGNINDDLQIEPSNDNERLDHNDRKSTSSRNSRRSLTPSNNSVVRSNPSGDRDVNTQYQILSSELGVQYALIEGILRKREFTPLHNKGDRQIRNSVEGDSTDLMRQQRLNRHASRKNKRRANLIQDSEPPLSENTQVVQSSRALVTRNKLNVAQNNTIVNSTVTFALYTLVIYLFGIITSVFVLDSNQGAIPYSDWLPYEVVRDESIGTKTTEIILYWIESLLSDRNMKVPT